MNSSRLKKSFWITSSFLLGACASQAPIKIYVSSPPDGLVRSQNKEVIPYDKTRGYFCISPDDSDLVIEAIQMSKGDRE